MTYEEKVRWLRRYQESLRREQELAEEVERLQSEATRITPLLSGMPGGPGDGQRLPRAVEKIIETKRQLELKIDECLKVRLEVEGVIEKITNSRNQEILRRRYLLAQKWEDISREMYLDFRWILKLHKKAVLELLIETR